MLLPGFEGAIKLTPPPSNARTPSSLFTCTLFPSFTKAQSTRFELSLISSTLHYPTTTNYILYSTFNMRFAVPALALFASLVSALPQTAAVEPTSAAASPAAPVVAPSAVPTHSTLPIAGGANAFTYPLGDVPLTAGKPVEIKWQANYGDKVTITLRKGDDKNNLDALVDVAVDVANSGSYKWTPSKELEGAENYALEIVSGNSNNFTPKFEIDSDGEGLASTKSAAKPAATETPTTSSASESASKTTSSTKSTATSDDDEDEDDESSSASSGSSSSSKTSSSASKTSTASDDEPTNDAVPDQTQEDSSATTVRSSFALLVGVVVAVAVFN